MSRIQLSERVIETTDLIAGVPDGPTPESIAEAFAVQQRERREVELETGLVYVGDRLIAPVIPDQVRLGLLISNAIACAVYGPGARELAPVLLRSQERH